jgi:hypothetical protein
MADTSHEEKDHPPLSHPPQTHITVNGDAVFEGSFNANRESLTPQIQPSPKEESLLRHFIKNPEKVRDWAIIIFIIYALIKGMGLKEILELIKGVKP